MRQELRQIGQFGSSYEVLSREGGVLSREGLLAWMRVGDWQGKNNFWVWNLNSRVDGDAAFRNGED